MDGKAGDEERKEKRVGGVGVAVIRLADNTCTQRDKRCDLCYTFNTLISKDTRVQTHKA